MTLEALRVLLGMEKETHAPTVILFAEQKNERLKFTCDFIFNTVLNINYRVMTDATVFADTEGFKLNYSNREFSAIPKITPAGLINEKEITRVRPVPEIRKDNLYLYSNKDTLGYDIFSAVFYMVSRYEEWQAFTPDKHQRFEANQSILFTHAFHLKPVVDGWIEELK